MTKKAATVNRQALGALRAVTIQISSDPPFASSTPFNKIIAEILKSEGVVRGFLAVVFVSDDAIRKLNRTFLKRDRPTDVLAFDYASTPHAGLIRGDVFISLDTARRVSKKLGISFEEEFLRYLIHAVLHLLGHDDTTLAKKKRMWKRQEKYVGKYMGTKSPGRRSPDRT